MGVAWSRTVSPTLIVSIEGVITTWMTWLDGVVVSLLQAQKAATAPRAKSVRIAARMKGSPPAMDQNTGNLRSSQSQRGSTPPGGKDGRSGAGNEAPPQSEE